MYKINKYFWKNKNIFITGHTGFKGGWLCSILKILGSNISGYSLKPPTKPNIFSDKIIGIFMASFGYIHYIKDNYLIKSKGISIHNSQNKIIVKNKNHYNYNCQFNKIFGVIKKNPSLLNIFKRKQINFKDNMKKNLLTGLRLLSKKELYSHKSQNIFKNTLNDILDIFSFSKHNKLFYDKKNHMEFLMIKKIVESKHE